MTKVNTILNEILKVNRIFYSVEVVTDVTLNWDFSDIGDTYITIYIYHGGKSEKYSTPRFCLQQYRKCAAIKQS